MTVTPQLLKDVAKGQRSAQYKLFRCCFNTLMSICVRYRSSHDEAVAMVNEGFLKILTNLDKYKPDVPFEAWIRRIMINVLIDDFRKNHAEREFIEYRDFSDGNAESGFSELNEADLRLDASEFEEMIRTLPPISGRVFNLYAIDGYSHAEIASMLGITEGTSKWHLFHARQRLMAALAMRKHPEKL